MGKVVTGLQSNLVTTHEIINTITPNSSERKEEEKTSPINVHSDKAPFEETNNTSDVQSRKKSHAQKGKRKNILNYSELCEEISSGIDDLFKHIDDSIAFKQEMSDIDYFNAVVDYYRRWKDDNEYDARMMVERARYTDALYSGYEAFLSNSKEPNSVIEGLTGLSEIIGSDEMPMKYFSDMTNPMIGWNSGQFNYLLKDYDKAKYIGISKYALAFAALLGAKTFHDVELSKDRKMVIADIATEALCLGFWYAELTSPGLLFSKDIAQKYKNRDEYYNSIINGNTTQYGSWARPFLSDALFDELTETREGKLIVAFGDRIIPIVIKQQQPSTSIFGLLFGKQKTEEKPSNPEPYYLCLLRFLLNNASVYFKVLEQCKKGNSKYLPNRIANFSYRER